MPADWNSTVVLEDGTVDPEGNPFIDNDGTSFALWMTVFLGVASTVSNGIVKYMLIAEQEASRAEDGADTVTIQSQIRAFAKATSPQPPTGCDKWKLPPTFFLACVGIKAQYFAPFGFTAFSNKVYLEKFGQTKAEASFLSVSFQWKNPDFLISYSRLLIL